jgi:hypothetical protein
LTSEHVEYFDFFDLDLLNLMLQETTMNGNKKKLQTIPHIKGARITDWWPPKLAVIMPQLGI